MIQPQISSALFALVIIIASVTSCTDPLTDSSPTQQRHFTGYAETDLYHKFILSNLTFNRASIPSGWELAVYTYGGVLSGSVVWNDTGEVVLKAWGADDLTEQFHADEKFDFRVWDNQTNQEFYADGRWTSGPTVWKANGLSEITVDGFIAREMTAHFQAGWNLISINVRPNQIMYNDNGPDIRKMMRQFYYGDNSHLILMKNERGNFYAPANRDFNNIPFWNVSEGYQVRIDSAMDAHWIGHTIDADEYIEIAGGWNMIAYFPTYPLSCSRNSFRAISSIRDKVVLVKDIEGNFASPRNNFSNMAPWREGRGYQINVRSACTLRYPEPETESPQLPDLSADSIIGPWRKPPRTGSNMSVLITAISNVTPNDSDAVAAFSASGLLVGLGRPTGGMIGLAVWGDDASTESVDGLYYGEAFNLKYWFHEDSTIIDLRMPELVYETDGFTSGIASVSP